MDIESLLLGQKMSGGGGSNWTLLKSEEFTVSTTSTSNTSVGTISLDLADYADKETMLWVRVRDKAGKRTGYFYGSDAIFINYQLANNNTNTQTTRPVIKYGVNSSGQYVGSTATEGVYAYSLTYKESDHCVNIYSKYNSSYGTIDGTFKVDVYKLTPPDGVTLFE